MALVTRRTFLAALGAGPLLRIPKLDRFLPVVERPLTFRGVPIIFGFDDELIELMREQYRYCVAEKTNGEE